MTLAATQKYAKNIDIEKTLVSGRRLSGNKVLLVY